MTAASKDLDKANNSLSNTIAPLEILVTSNLAWPFTNGSNLVTTFKKQCIILINLIYFYLHFSSLTIYVWN